MNISCFLFLLTLVFFFFLSFSFPSLFLFSLFPNFFLSSFLFVSFYLLWIFMWFWNRKLKFELIHVISLATNACLYLNSTITVIIRLEVCRETGVFIAATTVQATIHKQEYHTIFMLKTIKPKAITKYTRNFSGSNFNVFLSKSEVSPHVIIFLFK